MVFSSRAKIASTILAILVVIPMLLVIAQEQAWFVPQRTYFVVLKEGYHLHPGSLVKILNTEVGKVTNMNISLMTDRYAVIVTIKVSNEYAELIRFDSVAEVVPSIPVGNEYLDILLGSPNYPSIKAYGTIASQVRKPRTEK